MQHPIKTLCADIISESFGVLTMAINKQLKLSLSDCKFGLPIVNINYFSPLKWKFWIMCLKLSRLGEELNLSFEPTGKFSFVNDTFRTKAEQESFDLYRCNLAWDS